jgi:Gpi18-like mannosyltransferase
MNQFLSELQLNFKHKKQPSKSKTAFYLIKYKFQTVLGQFRNVYRNHFTNVWYCFTD